MEYPCHVCNEMMNAGMVQSGILIEGEPFSAHVGCADEWSSTEIDVWKITSPGNGTFCECFPENILEMLKEMDDESEYVIKKVRMQNGKYHSLPEFMGF